MLRLMSFALLLTSTATLWATEGGASWEHCEFAQTLLAQQHIGAQLNDQNVAYLDKQRTALQSLWGLANKNHFEADHAIWRTLIGEAIGGHAIYFGKAGAGKSDLLREMTHIARVHPSGTPKMDVYATLVHEQMGDSAIKGYVSLKTMVKKRASAKDIDEAISKETNRIGKVIDEEVAKGVIHNANTLIQYSEAMLDEVDKGNPITLAALLDVLNEKIAQYGFESQKVRTFFVGMTGNKTLFEFLEAFRNLGYPGTGEALLDRIPFKIYMHDYLADPALARELMKRNYDRNQKRAMAELQDPFARYRSQTATKQSYTSLLPDVDARWLGWILKRFVRVDDNGFDSIHNISDKMRIAYGEMVKANEIELAQAQQEGIRGNGYQPPSAISNRTYAFSPLIVQMSAFLKMMLLPNDFYKGIKTSDLATRMNEGKFVLNGASAWRLKESTLTSAVGDAFLQHSASTADLEVKFGSGLEKLLGVSTDSREHFGLSNIQKERDRFQEVSDEELKRHTARGDRNGIEEEILSKQ